MPAAAGLPPSPGVKTAIISDTHLGSSATGDVLRHEHVVDLLLEATEDCERLVLLGDTIELRDKPINEAFDDSEPFFRKIAGNFDSIVLVPGNHDHRLLGIWLERIRESNGSFALDEVVTNPHPYVARLTEWLNPSALELRYPGFWVRDDVYALHGHYGDSHVTLPTIERLSIATIDRVGGRPTGVRSSPQDYEKVHAPAYDLLFNLAQGGRNPHSHNDDGEAPSLTVWEMIGGASGQARNWRGRVLKSAVIPAALRGLERAGVGRFGRDFSLAEIGRSGVEAMHTVTERLEIGAEHVIFGHIHRKGPMPGEDGRSAADPEWTRRGVSLHNTGCWVYVPAMLEDAARSNPFWPGRTIVVDSEGGDPEAREVLEKIDRAKLEPPDYRD